MPYKRAPDVEISRIAERQHGAITHRQLLSAGLGRSSISERVARGRLHRLHQGVYAVGHVASGIEGRWMAAVLACGDGAVLSHGSAAAHWGLLRPLDGPVDVSVPLHGGRRRRRGIRLHRCASLEPKRESGKRLVTRHVGIPITTPSRMIADLPGAVSPRLVRRATRQAELLGLPLDPQLRSGGTRSDLEEDFLDLDRRLVVETDGYLYHRGKVAFEDDHERDLGLRGLGYDVLRLSEKQIAEAGGHVAGVLVEALAG